jgi:two-component system, chemotaxis family, sensor kinase CheA
MPVDMSQFHDVFFEESLEAMGIMESGLLNLDVATVNREEINSIFRAAHSIKGGSATFGFSDIASFTHVMETLLDEMRDGRRAPSADVVDVLLKAVDTLRDMVQAARGGNAFDRGSAAQRLQALEDVLAGRAPGSSSSTAVSKSGPVEAAKINAAQEAVARAYRVIFKPYANMLSTGNDPLRMFKALSEFGDIKVTVFTNGIPSLYDMSPECSYLSWEIALNTSVDEAKIKEVFEWVEGDCDLFIQVMGPESAHATPMPNEPSSPTADAVASVSAPTSAPVATPAPALPSGADDRKAAPAAKPSASGSIRVSTDKIDQLINMVGELVITQSMLSMFGKDFDASRLDRLRDGLSQLERHTRMLQESVMGIRMLPISSVFSRFPRFVHDLSVKLGKSVELKISGESTELDKTVIEQIGDPLVHLVRNSLDHGIEKPDVRRASGKSPMGVIQLHAYHKGGSIVIEISDDGAGLNRERILKKALEKDIISSSQAERMSDDEICELIFMPGFSTADTVSDVSGRGVGMDVVKKNIISLGGQIEIQSTPGRGSLFRIRLPLTLAILDGQSVAVGNEFYIIPLASIVESIQVKPQRVSRVAGRGEVIELRDEYVPVTRLYELFSVPQPKAREIQDGLLVIVEGDGKKIGLLVDELLGQQQVVIKSLDANFDHVNGISGATILGDGSVALILDIADVMRMAAMH